MPANCLLIEADDRLILVDSGLGLADAADPKARLGTTRFVLRPSGDPATTAFRQIEALGLDPHDVRDIVLTHADIDHTGGLADFPWARVHTSGTEIAAALEPRTRLERTRYAGPQLDHRPHWVQHVAAGISWRGFDAVEEILDGVLLVSFPGHTRGHCMVAVQAGERWLLHAGDAFYSRTQLDGRRTPRTVLLSERAFAHRWPQVRANHRRLAELIAAPGSTDLHVFAAHDPEAFVGVPEVGPDS
jgi:glyoxylase-like metal-dependent hydrolase (beta-lactamase superfamily II)